MTVLTPILFNIDALISPVKAPLSEKCMFWAATSIELPLSISKESLKLVNGGAIITSVSVLLYRLISFETKISEEK
jgi:hypothetical protein